MSKEIKGIEVSDRAKMSEIWDLIQELPAEPKGILLKAWKEANIIMDTPDICRLYNIPMAQLK